MQYEEQLRAITCAQWNTHYLTNEALVNKRFDILQHEIFGIKIGSLVGRVCKLLHLDTFESVRKFFICSDLQAACRIIKTTIILTNQISKLSTDEKRTLFDAVAKTVNTLINHVNSKRIDSEKLPSECTIDIAKLFAMSPKNDTLAPLSPSKESSVPVQILAAPSSPPASLALSSDETIEPKATDKVASSDVVPKTQVFTAALRAKKPKRGKKPTPVGQIRRVSARLVEKQVKAHSLPG